MRSTEKSVRKILNDHTCSLPSIAVYLELLPNKPLGRLREYPLDMSENNRDGRRYFQSEHTDREYLAVVVDREPAGTSEIAEEVSVTRQNADQRLRQLEDQGKVNCKKIGTSLVWSLKEDVHVFQHVDPDDSFWEAETYTGEEMSAADIDDILYS